MMIIDAHQHFWRISRGDYSWMDDSVAAIRRDHLPEDFARVAGPLGVGRNVIVQAAPTVAETRFLLGLKAGPVVGWVDLDDAGAPGVIDDLARDDALRGLRPMLQDIADTRFILRPRVLAGLDHAAGRGLSLDALVTPRHLAVLEEVVRTLPHLRVVIDHCAKPVIAGGADPGDDWRRGMERLAAHPQVFCKLSGLANEAGPGWNVDALRPVADHVLEVFGPGRVMWGSDWPVLDLAGDYAGWLAAARELVAPGDHDTVFGGAAAEFYRIGGME